jgi:hypothetical protein
MFVSNATSPYFPAGSIVTFSVPGTVSASIPESIRPRWMSPAEYLKSL